MTTYRVLHGDCRETLKTLPDESVHCVVTSPPYFNLRDYGESEQIGLEDTPEAFVTSLVTVSREIKRVLHSTGTFWLNLGDSYGQHKQLLGIPWRVAFALQADGWVLRQSIVWAKSKTMPEPVRDRCTRAHELIFMFAKEPRYYYDHVAIKEPIGESMQKMIEKGPKQVSSWKHDAHSRFGKASANHVFSSEQSLQNVAQGRNKRDVWLVNPKPYAGAHFAVYPPDLIEPCILAGTSAHGACADCGTPWVRDHNNSWRPDCECRGNLTYEEVVIPAKMTPEEVAQTGWSTNKSGEYHGQNAKDYASAMAQGASDVKRRIIENATKDRRKNGWVYRSDVPLEEHPVVPCVVLDPFGGSGTTAGVAIKHGRQAILCELNPDFASIMDERIRSIAEFVEEDVEDMEWL